MSKDNGGPASDRELLEMAAKAAGITIKPVEIKNVEFAGDDRFIGYSTDPHEWVRGWFNPLTDDGDALRLAVKLCIHTEIYEAYTEATAVNHETNEYWQINQASASPEFSDMMTATRRAIVRTAALIGSAM